MFWYRLHIKWDYRKMYVFTQQNIKAGKQRARDGNASVYLPLRARNFYCPCFVWCLLAPCLIGMLFTGISLLLSCWINRLNILHVLSALKVAAARLQITGTSSSSNPSYVARPQSKFPTRPTASKPYIARSDRAYVIEQCCSMTHAITLRPAFSQ
jgi:hypothetical protein